MNPPLTFATKEISLKRQNNPMLGGPMAALMSLALATPLRRVLVVGGTHGNEYTGVYVLERLARHRADLRKQYPSLAVDTLLANPRAHKENRRFIDHDLNRMFSAKQMNGGAEKGYEVDRASEISQNHSCDVCIDMHTTTANMGCTLIVKSWSPLTIRAAAYVMKHWDAECAADAAEYEAAVATSCQREQVVGASCDSGARQALPSTPLYVLLEEGTRESSADLCSLGVDAGFEIECGPTPQGMLRADVIASTERAVRLLLRYLEQLYSGQAPELPETIELYVSQGKHPFEEFAGGVREHSSLPASVVARSRQGRDFEAMHTGDELFERLDGTITPYDGRYGDVVYPVFINEAAYYYAQSGRGLGIATKVEEFPVPPLVSHDETSFRGLETE